MLNFDNFKSAIENSRVSSWADFFEQAVKNRFAQYTHGEYQSWVELIDKLPKVNEITFDLSKGVSIKTNTPLSTEDKTSLIQQLKALHPWRKGPFELFDIKIDTEWRSDWKWERIKPHIATLEGQSVLDIGCGNGYHCFRMLDENPRFVLGIDPSQKYLAQFSIIQNYLNQNKCQFLPLGVEGLPLDMENQGFDRIFCMGVLYHRKDPISLLYHIKNLLALNGQLILETLVIDGDETALLMPENRYAQMRNVWFLPSTKMLELWLRRCGFREIKTVDINQTSIQEQRKTEWMTFHSLEDFLDPKNHHKTIEGYPAPKRAVILAQK